MRAQQQNAGGYNNDVPSRYQRSDNMDRRQNPYAQQDNQYEMDNRQYEAATSLNAGSSDDMSAFYDEISSIQDALKQYNDNVKRISDLHQRSLNNLDEASNQRNNAQLEGLIEDTQELSNSIKNRITKLAQTPGRGENGRVRADQTRRVKEKFMQSIQSYQDVEKDFRGRQKQRMERQFKIVKPDATPEEIRAVVNDENGGQIFSQALMNSNRYGESRAAYREVQERHEDIKKIERTLTELAQLFNDMAVLVEQQDETINHIQEAAVSADKDLEVGLQETGKAVKSAAAARKKRWICFFIILIILAIVGIVVGIQVSKNINNK
jgi:syntaxin 1B/2/3